MTSHDFAKQLLAGPDWPIFVPKVVEYSDDDEDCVAEPFVTEEEGYVVATGDRTPILMIDRALSERRDRLGIVPSVPFSASASSAESADELSADTSTHD